MCDNMGYFIGLNFISFFYKRLLIWDIFNKIYFLVFRDFF